jgi:NAD(P)-dependent dehydrogenase (short-subunit alcohol dehydrogenase family)
MSRRYPSIDVSSAVVVITGAGRGIGQAAAELFHELGAIVWIGDIDSDAAEEVADHIGPGAFAYPLDVTMKASWRELVDRVVARHGHIDIHINSAGLAPVGSFLDEHDDTSQTTLDVNVMGLVHGMRAVLPGMIERGRGHIVNIASMAGKVPVAGMGVYNASKFAAVGLTASTRAEFENTGVSISAVLPSVVRTSMVAGVPLGRGVPTVEPQEVAVAVLRNCDTRKAEVTVPGHLRFWDLLAAVMPEPVLRPSRTLVGGRRLLTSVDEQARSDYSLRLARQVQSSTARRSGARA